MNPLQEWFQPEGDRYKKAPLETIKSIVNLVQTNIIVKEVGQGFGPKSLESLMKLPLKAIELSGFGGTNFSLLELSRHNAQKFDNHSSKKTLVNMGHTSKQMIYWINGFMDNEKYECNDFIISGGVKNLVDGYVLQQKLKARSIIGMASAFLEYAQDISQLRDFVSQELDDLKLAHKYLRGK